MRGIVGDFLENAFLMNAGGFGATADQRIDRMDQHVMRGHDRVRHLIDDDVLNAFADNLLHAR